MKSQSLSEDRLFQFVLLTTEFLVVFSSVLIFNTLEGEASTLCFTHSCFDKYLSVFAFPLNVVKGGIVLLALIGLVHRSEQTSVQLKESTTQNIIANCYNHHKTFDEFIGKVKEEMKREKILTDKVRLDLTSNLYNGTFPKHNFFKEFSPEPAGELNSENNKAYCDLLMKFCVDGVNLDEITTNADLIKAMTKEAKTVPPKDYVEMIQKATLDLASSYGLSVDCNQHAFVDIYVGIIKGIDRLSVEMVDFCRGFEWMHLSETELKGGFSHEGLYLYNTQELFNVVEKQLTYSRKFL